MSSTRADAYSASGSMYAGVEHFGKFHDGQDELKKGVYYPFAKLTTNNLLLDLKVSTSADLATAKIDFAIVSGLKEPYKVTIGAPYLQVDAAKALVKAQAAANTAVFPKFVPDQFILRDCFPNVTGWIEENWNNCQLAFTVSATGALPAGYQVTMYPVIIRKG